jgi:hypothetical protein
MSIIQYDSVIGCVKITDTIVIKTHTHTHVNITVYFTKSVCGIDLQCYGFGMWPMKGKVIFSIDMVQISEMALGV